MYNLFIISSLLLVIITTAGPFSNNVVGVDATTTTTTNHQLIFVAVSGLTSSGSTSRYMPYVQSFVTKGAWTPLMRTVHPNPKISWNSIFYALAPNRFGCGDEAWCGIVSQVSVDVRSWISILEEDFNYNVAIFSENRKLLTDVLGRPVTKFSYTKQGSFEDQYLPSDGSSRVVVLHFDSLDRIGEAYGYESTNYYAKVHCLDQSIYKAVMELWDYSPFNTTVMLVSNHGGVKFRSNKYALNGLRVPFMLWGEKVTPHAHFTGQITETLQIGPTILSLLGYEDAIPEEWLEMPIPGINTSPSSSSYANRSIFPERDEIVLNGYECQLPQSVSHNSVRRSQNGLIVLGLFFFFFGFFFRFQKL